jgi:hypothetical protein
MHGGAPFGIEGPTVLLAQDLYHGFYSKRQTELCSAQQIFSRDVVTWRLHVISLSVPHVLTGTVPASGSTVELHCTGGCSRPAFVEACTVQPPQHVM